MTGERKTILAVVIFLGVLAMIAVAGITYIAVTQTHNGQDEVKVPQALIAIGSALIGALSSMLVRTSAGNDAAPVEVPDAEPVAEAPPAPVEPYPDGPQDL